MKTRPEGSDRPPRESERPFHALAQVQSAREPEREAASIRWPGVILGLALVPLLASTLSAFWLGLTYVAVEHSFWKSAEFWFFHTGVVLWLICLAGFPPRFFHAAYVFGHEWTHALAALCCGGRLLRLPVVSFSGGHVVTDRSNLFITLAPYLIPFYSVLSMLVCGIANLFGPLPSGVLWTIYAVLGFTWAFHVTFTARMMHLRQPDFEKGGRFFSAILIGLVNLWLLCLFLVWASPNISLATFSRLWLEQTVEAAQGVSRAFGAK